MSRRDPALPDFANPPVEETVLSLQFAPPARFGVPHFGLYWARVRDRFGRFEVQGPINSVTEQYEPGVGVPPGFGVRLVSAPELRCWFMDETGTRLLQLQRDRFVHNWRRVTGTEVYPRYENVRDTLEAEWAGFCAFLDDEGIERPEVNQCEVTYVNHIAYGNGWSDYGELSKVVAPWSGRGSSGFLPHPERVSIAANYLLPDKAGRLHVSLNPVVRVRDSQEVLQLSFTARGAPASPEVSDVFAWLDLGREWVVKGFADFTARTIHELWGRKK